MNFVNLQSIICLCLFGAVISSPQRGYDYNQPPAPQPAPSNLYNTPSKAPPAPPPQQGYGVPQASNNAPVVADQPMEGMPYDFNWGVEDQESGNSYSHVENSDGQTTQGEYRVLLPDGRTQVVKFYDNGDGFNADVTYEKK